MASLVLLFSELLHPEDANLAIRTTCPPPPTKPWSATAASSLARMAARRLEGRLALGADKAEPADLPEMKVSLESIWP